MVLVVRGSRVARRGRPLWYCATSSESGGGVVGSILCKTEFFTDKKSMEFFQRNRIMARPSTDGSLKGSVQRWESRQSMKNEIVIANRRTTGSKLISKDFDLMKIVLHGRGSFLDMLETFL